MKFLLEEQIQYCPACGLRLRIRTNSKTQRSFLGCPGYPYCKFAMNFSIWDREPERLEADFYVSPQVRLGMDLAGSLGSFTGPIPLVNHVVGRENE